MQYVHMHSCCTVQIDKYFYSTQCIAGMSLCVRLCESWGQQFVYAFKVSMRNIMVKAAQRQEVLSAHSYATKDYCPTYRIYVHI